MHREVNPAVAWSILLIVILICVADFLWFYHHGVESTFSLTLRRASERWGFLPYIFAFGFGGLCGHFFWPTH